MHLLDSIRVRHLGRERAVELFAGDLADIPPNEAVDVLAVSALPDDYVPTERSLIGALHRAGVSVAALAEQKEVDLRAFSKCWLSRPVTTPGVNFNRLLCFEPGYRGRAVEVVGDIFRSIVPFTAGPTPISSIAMSLVATGIQGEPPDTMLAALTEAAVHWLSTGMPLGRIKIVLRPTPEVEHLRGVFARAKLAASCSTAAPVSHPYRFAAFVSYSHQNKDSVDYLVGQMLAQRPGLSVFVDRLELQPGHAWQQHIFDSLDQSQKIICVLSPEYLSSKVCIEEFNMAIFRHRETNGGVLLPVYLRSAALPTYMKMIQYEDVREADQDKLARVAERLVGRV